MSNSAQHFYEFGPFRLDRMERVLFRADQPLTLTPKAFDLLLALVVRHGHVIEKEALLDTVWPETVVEESNLTHHISVLRKVLGESAGERPYIETIPRRGYRFVSDVKESNGANVAPVVTPLPVALIHAQASNAIEADRLTNSNEPSSLQVEQRVAPDRTMIEVEGKGVKGRPGWMVLMGLLFALLLVNIGVHTWAGLKLSRSFGSGLVQKDEGRVESVVRLVNPDGPAAALRPGDVIVLLNGQPLDKKQFFRFFAETVTGTEYTVVVQRDGQLREFTLRTGAAPFAGLASLGLRLRATVSIRTTMRSCP